MNKGYRIRFVSEKDKVQYNDFLCHYGIKGQRWGVRRFQNPDGSYTAAGKERYATGGNYKSYNREEKKYAKEFDRGVKSGKYTNDPEIRDLYVMEQMEKRKNSIFNNPKVTSKDRVLAEKALSGQSMSEKEREALEKAAESKYKNNFKVRKAYHEILKRNDAWSSKKDPKTFSIKDQQKIDDLLTQMNDNRKAYADLDYALQKAKETKYKEEVSSETDMRYVDPSLRKFSSKEQKAKAEEDYMELIWYTDWNGKSEEDQRKWNRELKHLESKVNGMSMNGYEGLPKSERTKQLFDYVKDDSSFDTYDNWRPKYESSEEWKQLKSERARISKEVGLDKAESDWYGHDDTSAFKIGKLYRALNKAQKRYAEKVSGISARENEIMKDHHDKIVTAVLKDMGYEITPKNMELIDGLIWYD